MDDAHIFCARGQMADELHSLLTFVLELLGDFGLKIFPGAFDQTRGEGGRQRRRVGGGGTEALRQAGYRDDLELALDPGGGAFYGPKISVQARDTIGRTWQISTVQVDFQEPQRFAMDFVGQDNARHRPIMIHRALFGSVERFFAILLERYAGRVPDVAGAGPGPGAARARRPRPLCATGAGTALGGEGAGTEADDAGEPRTPRGIPPRSSRNYPTS